MLTSQAILLACWKCHLRQPNLVPLHHDYVVKLAQPRPRGSYVTVFTSLHLIKLKQDEVLTGKNDRRNGAETERGFQE